MWFLSTHTAFKQSLSVKGFTLVELVVAMALSLLTAFAITSAVSTAVNAATSYQARQMETHTGLVLASMIKNDLKRSTQAILDPSSTAGTQYIKLTQVDSADLLAGNQGHLVVYRLTGGVLSRATGALGAAVGGLSYTSIMPSIPPSFAQVVTCTYPCGALYSSTGAATATSSAGARFVISGLTINVDGADRFSALFDADANTYTVPKLEFFFPSGGTTLSDSTVDATALAS